MSFNEQLPKWDAPGVEPPDSKKTAGYQPDEKPPADWFNWIFNRIYKVLQELQAHKHTGAAGDADKIDSTGLANGAATDTVIGNRTVDDTATPNTGPNTITNILSFFGKMIRLITGENSWITAPAMTLKAIYNRLLATPSQTTADITYYVDSVNGDDTNDGLAAGAGRAFKTIQKALLSVPQIVNHTVTINVAAGTNTGAITVYGFLGFGLLKLVGEATNALTTTHIFESLRVFASACNVMIKGLKGTGESAFYAAICSNVTFDYCTTDGATTNGFFISNGCAAVAIQNSLISNKTGNAISVLNSKVLSWNNSGTGNATALAVDSGGTIAKRGTQPAGTTAEVATNGGVIR